MRWCLYILIKHLTLWRWHLGDESKVINCCYPTQLMSLLWWEPSFRIILNSVNVVRCVCTQIYFVTYTKKQKLLSEKLKNEKYEKCWWRILPRHSGQKIEIKKWFNQWRKPVQSKRKKLKVCYIGMQVFVQLPENWHTQQICNRTFVCIVCNLLCPAFVTNYYKNNFLVNC